jgi:hypothetical protein
MAGELRADEDLEEGTPSSGSEMEVYWDDREIGR